MHTKNLANEKYQALKDLFPNAITETKDENGELVRAIDKDILMQEISTKVVEGREERYQFTWPDKKKAILNANAPINKTFRPAREESVNFDETENLYIEGDNLEVLKLLQETYLGKVDVIYIDPPYNTGNDFVYNDDFKESVEEYLENSGQYDEEGNRLEVNRETNGRYHTDWLNMIYPRLKLSRDLLTDDGVIFISIDDNEQDNLKKICDEIFGEENFISNLVWSAGRKNDSKYISNSHEYILVYVKSESYLKENKIIWREQKDGLSKIFSKSEELYKKFGENEGTVKFKQWFKDLPNDDPSKVHKHYSNLDERGPYFKDNISWPGGGGPVYDVLHPKTGKNVKKPSRGWIYKKDRLLELIEDNRVSFGDDENSVPTLKRYLSDTPYQVMVSSFYSDNRSSMKRLRSLFKGVKVFDFPKDENIISKLISIIPMLEGSIILDFFSGSATTAHAVMKLNAEDGGNRKYIMVQLPEATNEKSEAYKAGYKTIAEIGKERIRRAGKKILEENKDKEGIEDLDIGFRVLKMDSSNMKDVYYSPADTEQNFLYDLEDNIKEDRTSEDLLFQVMLDLGVSLSSKIESQTIDGKEVFVVEEGFLIACFDKDVSEDTVKEIAKKEPYYAILRDNSMASDSVVANFDQIFSSISPETIRRVI